MSEIYDQIEDFKNFCYTIGETIEVCDPLDREVKGFSDENQAIKVADLVKKISKLKSVAGQDLSVPLDDGHFTKLMSLFTDQMRKINMEA